MLEVQTLIWLVVALRCRRRRSLSVLCCHKLLLRRVSAITNRASCTDFLYDDSRQLEWPNQLAGDVRRAWTWGERGFEGEVEMQRLQMVRNSKYQIYNGVFFLKCWDLRPQRVQRNSHTQPQHSTTLKWICCVWQNKCFNQLNEEACMPVCEVSVLIIFINFWQC